ncbi:hypothetical protein LUX29_21475 [Aureimonas altamirensis]|uniref:hypothetical protein n=1 Tax=Aureimonas altamirensis TaxID=370622 RepID=UPI001E5A085F|nr:hypothetical protein [Aureimonas altamirensis]UHD45526.1 hypothetical protein LUX29_21475 [Aureimonas altamirensis]
MVRYRGLQAVVVKHRRNWASETFGTQTPITGACRFILLSRNFVLDLEADRFAKAFGPQIDRIVARLDCIDDRRQARHVHKKVVHQVVCLPCSLSPKVSSTVLHAHAQNDGPTADAIVDELCEPERVVFG